MKKILFICAGLLLAGSFVFASGSQPQPGRASGSISSALTGPGDWNYKYPELITVNIGSPINAVMNNYPEGEDYENNAYTRWMKDTWNIEIKTGFSAQSADYTQRVTLAIASGDIPDVLILDNQQQLRELMESGMVEDLTGLFDKWASPLFKALINGFGGLEAVWPSTFMNGRQYANASTATGQDSLFWVREDWRLKLGLPEPKTIDDFVNLAQAFIDNDMAGNNLTAGIEISTPIAGFPHSTQKADAFFAEVGAHPRLWVDGADGKITYGSIMPEAKEGLRTMRDLYAKGIFPKDYVTRDHNAALAAGQIGVFPGPWSCPDNALALTVNNNPNAVWRPYSWVSAKTGLRYAIQPNNQYGWLVVRKGYNHPEMATRLENLTAEVRCYYDGLILTPEEEKEWQVAIPESVRNAYTGRQGIYWASWPSPLEVSFVDMIARLASLEKMNLDRFKAGDTAGMDAATMETMGNIVKWETGADKSFWSWNNWARYEAKQFSLIDADTIVTKKAYWPYNTTTMQSRWANLTDLENLTYNNIIMGIQPLDDFDTFVRDWLAQGGQTILQEVNEQFGR